jgi:uncharacterized protein
MTTQRIAGMACPVCRSALSMTERKGIEIDYCPNCRGIWLDRGELDKIIERSIVDDIQPPPAQHHYPPQPAPRWEGHEDRGGPKRRKSFLEELFD